jgi:putative lipoic acid-binding regulatory protein
VQNVPSVALLEAVHAFPCPYMFKVIGRSEGGFVDRTLTLVREELRLAEVAAPFRVRRTPGGRHVAVTLELTMRTAEEVRGVYRRLLELAGLVLLL